MVNKSQGFEYEIMPLEKRFKEIAQPHKAVRFEEECNFALQALNNNGFLGNVARSNPDSLQSAIYNVAACGISLNPIKKHAYLIPRKLGGQMAVTLDVSYQGLIHIATQEGQLIWVRCTIVHEKDEFEVQGLTKEPYHNYNPFGDRGKMVGVYATAKISNGDILTHAMPIEKVLKIRDRSESYKAYKNKKVTSPWITDEEEMIKKTCIRQASKLWPKTKNERLEKTLHNLNEVDGINFEEEKQEAIKQKREENKPEDEKEKLKLREDIHKILVEKWKEINDKNKWAKFLLEECEIKQFDDLKKKDLDFLQNLKTKLEAK